MKSIAAIGEYGVGNFRQKIIPRKTELTEQLVCSGGIPTVPRNRKLSEFRSEPLRRSKMFGILYSETKIEANTRNSVPNHSAEEKPTRNSVPRKKISCNLRLLLFANLSEFRSEAFLGRKQAVNTVCWSRIFYITNFLMSFRSVPSLGIDSSANLANASK